MKIRFWFAGITGLVIGVSAAAAEAFFGVRPPPAYGYCMVCHPGIMVKWGMNNIFGTDLAISPAFVLFPSLLAVGIVIGAFAAADRNKEVAWQTTPVKNRYKAALFGFLVATFGLVMGACPVRLGLLVSYGSITGVVLLAFLVGGIGLACVYLRLRKETTE